MSLAVTVTSKQQFDPMKIRLHYSSEKRCIFNLPHVTHFHIFWGIKILEWNKARDSKCLGIYPLSFLCCAKWLPLLAKLPRLGSKYSMPGRLYRKYMELGPVLRFFLEKKKDLIKLMILYLKVLMTRCSRGCSTSTFVLNR